jgi:hypothetical protein
MRTVFTSYKGETRLVVRFADARKKREVRRRPDRVRRRADRDDWQRTRNRRRGRNRFSSQSRSRSRKRIKKERSKSGGKKVKDESLSPSDQRESNSRSRDRSISSDRSRSRSRERYKFSSDESVKASESDAQKRSQRASSVEANPPAEPPAETEMDEKIIVSLRHIPEPDENIIVCCKKGDRNRSVLINQPPGSNNSSARASRSNSLHADRSPKLLPVSAGEDISPPGASREVSPPINYKTKPSRLDTSLSDPAFSDDQPTKPFAKGECKAGEPPQEPKSQEKSSPVRSPSISSVNDNAEEDHGLSPSNEKEWENFNKFKKMRIRVRWQAYQQYQGQVKLLETKNLELEEDLLQLEGQCRYWKDKFKRTLKEYRDSKDHLRKARRFSFEEEATIV